MSEDFNQNVSDEFAFFTEVKREIAELQDLIDNEDLDEEELSERLEEIKDLKIRLKGSTQGMDSRENIRDAYNGALDDLKEYYEELIELRKEKQKEGEKIIKELKKNKPKNKVKEGLDDVDLNKVKSKRISSESISKTSTDKLEKSLEEPNSGNSSTQQPSIKELEENIKYLEVGISTFSVSLESLRERKNTDYGSTFEGGIYKLLEKGDINEALNRYYSLREDKDLGNSDSVLRNISKIYGITLNGALAPVDFEEQIKMKHEAGFAPDFSYIFDNYNDVDDEIQKYERGIEKLKKEVEEKKKLLEELKQAQKLKEESDELDEKIGELSSDPSYDKEGNYQGRVATINQSMDSSYGGVKYSYDGLTYDEKSGKHWGEDGLWYNVIIEESGEERKNKMDEKLEGETGLYHSILETIGEYEYDNQIGVNKDGKFTTLAYMEIAEEIGEEISETYNTIKKLSDIAPEYYSENIAEAQEKLQGLFNLVAELQKLEYRELEAPGTLRAVKDAYEQAGYKSEIGEGIGQAVHHLEGYNWKTSGRIDPNNLILLSNEIHDEFHKLFGTGNNTIEQFIEFLKEYHPEELPKFMEKYGGWYEPKNVNSKLYDERENWDDSTYRKQYNRWNKLPWLKDFDGEDKALFENMTYSDFFLKDIEVPIEKEYKNGDNVFKSARLSSSDSRILDIYGGFVENDWERFGDMDRSQLAHILNSRLTVEALNGVIDEKDVLDVKDLVVFSKDKLLDKLRDSQRRGRKVLEDTIKGERELPFLGEEFMTGKEVPIQDNPFADSGLGKGLIPVIEGLKEFFEEYGEVIGIDNPFKKWDSSNITSKENIEILSHLFNTSDLTDGFSARTILNHVLASLPGENGEHRDKLTNIGDPNIQKNRIREFNEAYYDDSNNEKLNAWRDAKNNLAYLLGIGEKGASTETISEFFSPHGKRKPLSAENVRKAFGFDPKLSSDTTNFDAQLADLIEALGYVVKISENGGLFFAKDLRDRETDPRDEINYIPDNMAVYKEGTQTHESKKLEEHNEEVLKKFIGEESDYASKTTGINTISIKELKELTSIISSINDSIKNLEIAINGAVGYMKNAFGYAPSKASKKYDEEVSSVSPHKYLKTVNESKDTTQTIEQVIANSDLEIARERFREVQKEIGMLRGEGMSSEEIKAHPLVQESHELQNTIKELMLEATGSYDVEEEIKELKRYIASIRRNAKNTNLPSLLKGYEKRIKDAEEMIKILEMGDVESFQNDYYASFQGIPEPTPFVNNLTNIMNEVYGGTDTSVSSNPNNIYRPHPRIKTEPDEENVRALFGQRFRYLHGQYDDLKNKILPLQNVVISPNVSDETKEEYDALVDKIKRVHDALMSLRTNKSFNVEWEDELNEIVKGYEGVALSVEEVIKREEVLDALYGEEFKKLDARNRQGINELFGFDRDYGVDPKYAGKELKDNTKAIESPLNRAQSTLSKFAWQFDRATYSATQLNGVVTKLFAIVGSGNAVNDMITASSLRQTNQIMLASRRGMQEAEKLYDRIQMLVVKLPGNDTFLTNILTMLGTMDESLTAEDLEYMGGIIADYYMGAQAKGQFNNETERELRNYLMTGQTRNLTNSIIASEVESLKNLNSVKERTMALEKALQKTGMDSIAHYKSYHNTLEEFKGRFQKSFADLGDLYLGFLQGLMEIYNFLDGISGSFLSQLTISLGVFALGALGLTVALAQVTQTMAGTIDAIKHLKDAVETGKGLEGEYGEAIRKTIAWILFKTGIINEETASKVINTDATLRNTISEKLNSLSIRENIGSKVASTIAWFGNTKQKVVARLETYKNILATKLETLNTWIETGSVIANTKAWARNTKEKAKNRLAGYGDGIKGFLGGKLGVESTWGSIFGDVFGRGVNMLFRIGEAIVKFLRTPLGEIVGIVGTIIAIIVLAVRYIGQLFGWWSSFGDMFQSFGDGIRRTWEAFVNSEPIQYMITTFQNFAYTLEGVFNLIRDIGGSIWEMIFGVDKGGNKVFDIVGAFLEVIGAIGNIAFMISPIKIILDIINAIGSAIAWALDTWNEFIDSAEFQGLLKDFQEIRGIIGEAWSTLTEAFNEVRDAFMSVFEDDDEMKEMVENTNILLEVLKAVATLLRVTVVPVIRLVAYIIKGIADVIKFVVDVGIGVVDFFTGGALTNSASSLPTQKQLAQSYSNRVNNTQTIINNNFASGSVLTDARNMTAKEVMKLFTSAFGFNKSRGVNGVLS